ncbi:MAG: hypothetical protein ACYTF0_07410 [Planctomycetota bacterium]
MAIPTTRVLHRLRYSYDLACEQLAMGQLPMIEGRTGLWQVAYVFADIDFPSGQAYEHVAADAERLYRLWALEVLPLDAPLLACLCQGTGAPWPGGPLPGGAGGSPPGVMGRAQLPC